MKIMHKNVVIAGSRSITDKRKVFPYIKEGLVELAEKFEPHVFKVKKIISGGARGIDSLAEEFALAYNIPFKRMDADWDQYGKKAGHLRNAEMAEKGDALILIWDGESRGSKNMLSEAKRKNLKIVEVLEEKPKPKVFHTLDNW